MLTLPKSDADAVRKVGREVAVILAAIEPEFRTAAVVLFVWEVGYEMDGYDRAFAEMLKEAFGYGRPIPEPSIN